jgi:hypothetical protein
MDPIYPYGRCWLAGPLEVYVELLSLPIVYIVSNPITDRLLALFVSSG